MDGGDSTEGEGSGKIHLPIAELSKLTEYRNSASTIFAPHSSSIEKRDSSNANSVSPSRQAIRAPEKKLTLFALHLAVLEKVATGMGALGFIWATVVLLGGFAITLDKTDFWFITIILLIEGFRIFSRSHELEWQHQATWSITDAGINSFGALRSSSHFIIKAVKAVFCPISSVRLTSQQNREIAENAHNAKTGSSEHHKLRTRTWISSDVPLLPYAPWVFLSRNISRLLYWLQVTSATACVVLSLMKIIRCNFGDVAKGDTDKRNREFALLIFYSLALAEAVTFLLEKTYWEWKITFKKLLDSVNKELELGPSGMVSIKRFFYDAYSKCVNGSIFDGLKMDMVSFAMELLGSDSQDEQLIGVGILKQFALNERYSDDTLQKIGISLSVMERLVEMLNWKDLQEEEIRKSAAEILSKLAGEKQNSLRVAGIPGAMESISSLLYANRINIGAADEISDKRIIADKGTYDFWTFNHLGLLILKKLARDHDNCGKIGNTRGLLPKIIDFTHAGERLLKEDNATTSQIFTVKRSLQVVKMLASTTGATGKQLRKEISEIVFTISYIREILHHGKKHPLLQELGIEILTSLALEQDATERIGGTGGILKELFNIFFNEEIPECDNHVRIAAGEALAMLAQESKSNCYRILKLEITEKLIEALTCRLLRVNAARILRNLCTYTGAEAFYRLRVVTAAVPTVLKAIMSAENKLQEVMVGLAAHTFKYMTPEESSNIFEETGITEAELARMLIQILQNYKYPPIKIPRIRRFTIELAIWMMRDKKTNIQIFNSLGLKEELEGVMETTTDLESFNIFSGTVGLSRHSITIHTLVETALQLLAEG
ncbi:hypothetical protein RJ641_021186 [Dillenia turbinata]|uniref:Uncharacterized protein n=1 Tax=Dillenia turbinata TaxID=194707 RepID=A0AAN8UEB2_9MAGN